MLKSLFRSIGLVVSLSLLTPNGLVARTVGPDRGALIIVGGGKVGPEIMDRFIELAGGKDAPVVFIPTAAEGEPNLDASKTLLAKSGMTHVTVVHTRDRKTADTDAFVAPLRTAHAIWFEGGRQWRLVDSYLNTLAEKEMWNVLKRGGVVGGSSAGATIQGSYLVRGAREGNTVMMAPGYEEGFAFLRDAAIDQHINTRHREKDMQQVIERHPDLLGIGLYESTAIVVAKDHFEVVGPGKVAITDAKHKGTPGEDSYYFLSGGDRFDLKHRRKIS